MSDRVEIRDYEIEFSGEKEVDVPDIQATLIIKAVLDALNISFEEINIKSKIKYVFSYEETNEIGLEFPRGEPKYYYAEADIRKKMVEVGIDDYVIRIPLNRILFWFAQEQEETMI